MQVVCFDANANEVEVVNFSRLKSSNGAMRHLGDEREGDAVGDDESIQFDLARIPKRAAYLCFVINSFSGQELNDVKDARCRLYNSNTLDVACEIDMTADKRLDCTALLMCIIFRKGLDWYMHAVEEPANGRTAKDNVDEFQDYLIKTPLMEIVENKYTGPARTAKIKVPAAAVNNPKRTIGFSLGNSGGKEEVHLPPSVKAGDTIEVPIIDIYVA